MIETQRPCLDVAQQLYAVKKAIAQAKKTLIHDHIENCLEQGVGPLARAQRSPIDEFKVITKHLNVADHGPADRTDAIGPAAGWLLPSALVLGVLHGLEPGHSKTIHYRRPRELVQAVLLGFAAM